MHMCTSNINLINTTELNSISSSQIHRNIINCVTNRILFISISLKTNRRLQTKIHPRIRLTSYQSTLRRNKLFKILNRNKPFTKRPCILKYRVINRISLLRNSIRLRTIIKRNNSSLNLLNKLIMSNLSPTRRRRRKISIMPSLRINISTNTKLFRIKLRIIRVNPRSHRITIR